MRRFWMRQISPVLLAIHIMISPETYTLGALLRLTFRGDVLKMVDPVQIPSCHFS